MLHLCLVALVAVVTPNIIAIGAIAALIRRDTRLRAINISMPDMKRRGAPTEAAEEVWPADQVPIVILQTCRLPVGLAR